MRSGWRGRLSELDRYRDWPSIKPTADRRISVAVDLLSCPARLRGSRLRNAPHQTHNTNGDADSNSNIATGQLPSQHHGHPRSTRGGSPFRVSISRAEPKTLPSTRLSISDAALYSDTPARLLHHRFRWALLGTSGSAWILLSAIHLVETLQCPPRMRHPCLPGAARW